MSRIRQRDQGTGGPPISSRRHAVKNFGVTRHGRVVFYDYDEIEYITDCNFRTVPAAAQRGRRDGGRALVPGRQARRVPRDRWHFLLGNPNAQRLHEAPCRPADAGSGKREKQRIMDGYIDDVFPYDPSQRQRALSAPASKTTSDASGPRAGAALTLTFPPDRREPLPCPIPIVIVSAARTPHRRHAG